MSMPANGTPGDATPAIEFQGAEKTYFGATPAKDYAALAATTLSIAQGEFVSMSGPPAAASPRCSTWWRG
ncbi:hypothetical protein L535_1037 [Bordetella bronchiseptica SBL-F6116]|nr:hypothetical protein L535_1037 [Bordetella bronchiseptica SBL-F6116]